MKEANHRFAPKESSSAIADRIPAAPRAAFPRLPCPSCGAYAVSRRRQEPTEMKKLSRMLNAAALITAALRKERLSR